MSQTEADLIRARSAADAIAERNRNPRVVKIGGPVGGRESNPDLFFGYGVRYTHAYGEGECLKFWPGDAFRDWHRVIYVVDGVPMYVAGWQGAGNASHERAVDGYLLLHPYVPEQTFTPRRAYFLLTDKA